MIRWLPNTNNFWSPVNIDNVQIYGLEATASATVEVAENQQLQLATNYAYTVSENRETNEQLIYVPYHRGNTSVAYHVGPFNAFYQHLYNGAVRIIGGELSAYQVANAGLNYTHQSVNNYKYTLGLTVNNVFNTYYENVALRPMPNRNIQTQLTLIF